MNTSFHRPLVRGSVASDAEAQFAALIEFSGDAIISTTPEGIITRWSAGAERIFGYSALEIVGKSVLPLIPSDRIHEEEQILARVRRGDGVNEFETTRLRKDQTAITVWISIAPIKDGRGQLIGISKVARDITVRKREEEALRLSEARYRRLFETAQDGILILDATTGQVVDANPFMRVLLGYSLEEFAGKKLWEVGPFKGIEASKTIFAELQLKDSVRYESLTLERKDGGRVEAEFISNAYVAAERRFIQCNIRDITERRRLEILAEGRIVELARSNDELAQFGYVASHDLQEPLRAVASCVQLLQKRYGGQLDARADEFIAHAVAGIKRMETLIKDLLAYSRLGSQAQPLVQTNCAAVLANALANLTVAITESGAVVTHEALPVVDADPTQLVQVFQNLLSNAVKFRGTGAPAIHVGAVHGAGEWTLSVADNGIGMEPQYFTRIFEVFQRLHTRREYHGTGIGLAICKKIIERHGGRIWVESQPGAGSVFRFTLPERSSLP